MNGTIERAREARRLARTPWTPETEAAAFRLSAAGYVSHTLEARTDSDREELDYVLDRLLDYVQPPHSGIALDLGAGEGWATRRLAEKGFDAIGLERGESVARRGPPHRMINAN